MLRSMIRKLSKFILIEKISIETSDNVDTSGVVKFVETQFSISPIVLDMKEE